MIDTAQSTGTPVEILIAEDSPTQSQQLQHILEQQGYHVTATTNGREALEAAQRHQPTLIISDVVMPEMDGYELCRRVKSDARLADTPVILVTTLSDPQDVIRGLECRADNFILKPYDERHLVSRVRFVLVNREVRQSEQFGMGVEIFFNGEKHFITADRLQILNLLLSTYEAAIQRNNDLSLVQNDLHTLNSSLEAANKELEAFSYSVSHDLRAPLRHVMGFVKLLEQDAGPSLSEESLRHLTTISQSAKRMGDLIDDLLAFSRIRQSEMQQTEISLDRLVQETLNDFQVETEERNIAWEIHPLPAVLADRALLRLVLVNLMSNAVKFTGARTQAQIEIGWVPGRNGETAIFIRDNGAGFDPRYAGKLFGVFQRLHSNEEFEGTGIGLANVRRIIQRHGGRVWAEGAVNQGATFYFALPALEEPSHREQPDLPAYAAKR
jgi:two-component system sensor histidine kinase/response regulator